MTAPAPFIFSEICNNASNGMAALWVNLLTNLAADSENPEYPVGNVLDQHPKKVWKSGVAGSSTISFDIAQGSNCLTIFGTNASKIAIKFFDPNAIAWEESVAWEPSVAWEKSIEEDAYVFDLVQQGNTYAIWLDFKALPVHLKGTISFIAPGNEPVHVGVLLGGVRKDVGVNPLKGLTEGLVSYSSKIQLTNGAWWAEKRDIVRKFSGTIFIEREPVFYDFMYRIARELEPFPAAWKVTDINLHNWIVYGMLEDMPTGTHEHFQYSTINFNILEVI